MFSASTHTSFLKGLFLRDRKHIYKADRLFSPVPDEARVTLVDVHYSLWVHVKPDEDSSQQVTSSWTQCSHYIHDG